MEHREFIDVFTQRLDWQLRICACTDTGALVYLAKIAYILRHTLSGKIFYQIVIEWAVVPAKHRRWARVTPPKVLVQPERFTFTAVDPYVAKLVAVGGALNLELVHPAHPEAVPEAEALLALVSIN